TDRRRHTGAVGACRSDRSGGVDTKSGRPYCRGRKPEMNIPEAAIEAAAEGIYDAAFGQELPEAPIDLATAALEAALPHLEAALRKQIAADIERRKRDLAEGYADMAKAMLEAGMEEAARIAEKGNSK